MQIDDSWYRRPAGIEEHHSAGGVIVRAQGAALLIALLREGERRAYTLPKGHVDAGERFEDAARREVAEESGLGKLVLLGPLGTRERLDFDRTSWKTTHYFLFLALEEEARAGSAEYQVAWFPIDRLPEMFWPEQRELVVSSADRIRAVVSRYRVQQQFARQTGAYARSESHARDRDLHLLVEQLRVRPADRVLDIATGTGFTAFALAQSSRFVVGLDLTLPMLREARALAPVKGIRWVAGDAGALPFASGTFDAVTVRRAPHHFPDVPGALRETLRVLVPGGRVGIVDQVPPEEAAGRALMEHLEKLRDPSHVEAYTARRWRALLETVGVAISFADVVERRYPFHMWLEMAGTDPVQQRAIEDALRAAPPAARAEIGDDGSAPLSFIKRWVVLVGTKR